MRILLVDRAKQGPTARIVEAAVERRRKASESCIDLSITAPDDLGREADATPSSGRLVLVTVSESELSRRSPGEGGRSGCESVIVAQALARGGEDKLCLIRSDDPPLSGVHVIAALSKGIAAVVDDRLLLIDGVLDALFEKSQSDHRWRSIVVIGKSAIAVRKLRAMLNEWEEGALGGDGTLDPACWRTAMALAQLDELRPIAGTGTPYSFVKLAHGLNLREEDTSFHLSDHDLRKTVAMLASVWIDSAAHPSERLRLPAYAKAHGFPQQLPVIDGIDDKDIPKRLYDLAREMEVLERTGFEVDAPRVVLRVPTKLFRNHI